QRPDSGLHFPSAVAIAVSQALFRTLKGRRLQLLAHLCVEYLVYDTLQQLSHTLVSTKKLVQYLAIYGNLVLGHPLQPPVGFVDQLNHYQEGGVAYLLLCKSERTHGSPVEGVAGHHLKPEEHHESVQQ